VRRTLFSAAPACSRRRQAPGFHPARRMLPSTGQLAPSPVRRLVRDDGPYSCRLARCSSRRRQGPGRARSSQMPATTGRVAPGPCGHTCPRRQAPVPSRPLSAKFATTGMSTVALWAYLLATPGGSPLSPACVPARDARHVTRHPPRNLLATPRDPAPIQAWACYPGARDDQPASAQSRRSSRPRGPSAREKVRDDGDPQAKSRRAPSLATTRRWPVAAFAHGLSRWDARDDPPSRRGPRSLDPRPVDFCQGSSQEFPGRF
jgi:hypothetical protein